MDDSRWTLEEARRAFSNDPNVFEKLPIAATDEQMRIEWASLDGRHLASIPGYMRSADVCRAAVRSCSDSWEFLPPDMQADPAMRDELRETLKREMMLNPFARFGAKGAMLKELDRQEQAAGLKPADQEDGKKPKHSLLSAVIPAWLACSLFGAADRKKQDAAQPAEEVKGPRL